MSKQKIVTLTPTVQAIKQQYDDHKNQQKVRMCELLGCLLIGLLMGAVLPCWVVFVLMLLINAIGLYGLLS